MNKTTKKLILLVIAITAIKFIISLFITTPTIYSDEYIYIKMSQSFSQELTLKVHGIPTTNYFPLYPIIQSISFLLNNASIAYLIMKIINVILSTLIIIPAYLISKEFINKKKSILVAAIISLMPMNFVFLAFIMAENLFYPLFLTSIYLIYKSFTEKNYKYDIPAGIFIGLTFLTRFAGIALVGIVIIMFLYKLLKKEFFEIKKKTVMGLTTLIVILPWFIRNAINFGFSLQGMLGQYSSEITKQVSNYPLNMIYWIVLYSIYFLFTSFIIITLLSFSNLKEKFKEEKMKIFILIAMITLFVVIIGAAQHAAKSGPKEETNLPGLIGRPIGRYVDTALPILYILGLITFFRYKKDKKTAKIIFLISIPLIILGSQLLYFKLIPVNNISLTLLGVTNLALLNFLNQKLSIIIITTVLIFSSGMIYYLYKNSKIKLLSIISILLIITNLVAYAGIIHNSKTNWENHPQIELSKWISKNIDKNSKILVDEDYCGIFDKNKHEILCTSGKSTALTALWIMNPVSINSIENDADYIITMKGLDLKLIKETPNNIHLYETK